MSTKIGVMGITGRMGRLIAAEIIHSADSCHVSSAYAQPGQKAVGQDIGRYLNMGTQEALITDQLSTLFAESDVVIDFTEPAATRHHLQYAEKTRKPMVIGTTGLTSSDHNEMERISRTVPLLYSANMTLGMTLLQALVKKAAKVLDADFDVEILEMHHRLKQDAPSGTSLALGQHAAQGRNVAFPDAAVFDRVTHPTLRKKGDIGFAVMRGGNVFGDHSVVFASDHEVLTLSHRVLDRAVFAKGAMKAAIWLHHKPAGLYDMSDVLGLKGE